MDELLLEAEARTAMRKKTGALRRSGITPIHVYGRGGSSLSLQADTHELVQTLVAAGRTSPLTVKVGGDTHFVMVQQVQRHPVTERLLHVDLLRVSRTERIRAAVPLRFEGEAPGARLDGAALSEDLHEVEVEALPTSIPHELIVDLSALTEEDSAIRVSDLEMPADVSLATDADAVVARIVQSHAPLPEEEAPAEVEAEAAAEAPSEGEEQQ